MASPTWWTWVWVDSESWWWTGRPGVLQFMGSQRVRHDWATELNWTEPWESKMLLRQSELTMCRTQLSPSCTFPGFCSAGTEVHSFCNCWRQASSKSSFAYQTCTYQSWRGLSLDPSCLPGTGANLQTNSVCVCVCLGARGIHYFWTEIFNLFEVG